MFERAEGPGELTRRKALAAGAGLVVGALEFGFVREAAAARESITQIATFGLNAEREDEALDAIRRMCDRVEAEEPGVLAYAAYRSEDDLSRVVFFEIYADAAAVEAHGTTPHMGEFGSAFGSLLLPPVELEKLTPIAGFTNR